MPHREGGLEGRDGRGRAGGGREGKVSTSKNVVDVGGGSKSKPPSPSSSPPPPPPLLEPK